MEDNIADALQQTDQDYVATFLPAAAADTQPGSDEVNLDFDYLNDVIDEDYLVDVETKNCCGDEKSFVQIDEEEVYDMLQDCKLTVSKENWQGSPFTVNYYCWAR